MQLQGVLLPDFWKFTIYIVYALSPFALLAVDAGPCAVCTGARTQVSEALRQVIDLIAPLNQSDGIGAAEVKELGIFSFSHRFHCAPQTGRATHSHTPARFSLHRCIYHVRQCVRPYADIAESIRRAVLLRGSSGLFHTAVLFVFCNERVLQYINKNPSTAVVSAGIFYIVTSTPSFDIATRFHIPNLFSEYPFCSILIIPNRVLRCRLPYLRFPQRPKLRSNQTNRPSSI